MFMTNYGKILHQFNHGNLGQYPYPARVPDKTKSTIYIQLLFYIFV